MPKVSRRPNPAQPSMLASVEAAVPPRSRLKVREIRRLIDQLKAVPDLRAHIES